MYEAGVVQSAATATDRCLIFLRASHLILDICDLLNRRHGGRGGSPRGDREQQQTTARAARSADESGAVGWKMRGESARECWWRGEELDRTQKHSL